MPGTMPRQAENSRNHIGKSRCKTGLILIQKKTEKVDYPTV